MTKQPAAGTRYVIETYDVVVAGGGMAGVCCAIQAAREGLRVCLVHDRPVLGGVSSSEMRVTIHGSGSNHAYGRETGILSELLIEERSRNHETINENGWTNSMWDMVLYDWVMKEPLLTLKLNTQVVDVVLSNSLRTRDLGADRPPVDFANGYGHRPACNEADRIAAVIAIVGNAQTELELRATQFVDCTGDAVVADLAGCEWRWGTESHAETGEDHAADRGSTDVMGNSIHIRCRDMGREIPYTAPDWAVKHEDASYFYTAGRNPNDPKGGFWWFEISVPYNTIYDNEAIRHELTRHALGVWDWMKNRDPKMREVCRTYALEFIGQVPGKRENRRVMGQRLLTEQDVSGQRRFADEVAFGGWYIDLHTPGGLLASAATEKSHRSGKSHIAPYGIPLGALVSKDIANLAMAGRNISVTHVCLGTVRVMGTTSLMGQALGAAIAEAHRAGVPLAELGPEGIAATQQRLLRAGCFLPNIPRADPADLAPLAVATASSTYACVGNLDHLPDGPSGIPWQGNGLTPSGVRTLALDQPQFQLIPVDGGRVDSLAFELSADTDQTVELTVFPPRCLWDYDLDEATALRRLTLQVPAGTHRVRAPLDLALNGARGYLCCRLAANPAVRVATRPVTVPGAVAYTERTPVRLRSHGGVRFALAFEVAPAQQVTPPESVLTGPTRPVDRPNRWMSDPAQPLPQYLQLTWPTPQTFSRVELTFPGHLLSEYHYTPPLIRDGVIPRDLRLDVLQDGTWRPLATLTGNYQRQLAIPLRPITTPALRLLIVATNGSPYAQLAELRVY